MNFPAIGLNQEPNFMKLNFFLIPPVICFACRCKIALDTLKQRDHHDRAKKKRGEETKTWRM
jgi:hypothetical protein